MGEVIPFPGSFKKPQEGDLTMGIDRFAALCLEPVMSVLAGNIEREIDREALRALHQHLNFIGVEQSVRPRPSLKLLAARVLEDTPS